MSQLSFPKYARTQINWKIQNLSADILGRANFPNLESQTFQIHLKNHKYAFATTKW